MYGRSFDLLYVSEELVLAAGLVLVWRRSRGPWRRIYFDLFVATLIYCVASLMASEAIDLHLYYTGSLFDVPLIAGIAWFMRIGFLPYETTDEDSAVGSSSRGYGIWKARLAMVAVFVTPLMVGWARICRRCSAERPHLSAAANRGRHGRDGCSGFCETTFA